MQHYKERPVYEGYQLSQRDHQRMMIKSMETACAHAYLLEEITTPTYDRVQQLQQTLRELIEQATLPF